MSKIKTRETHRNIKTLDKATVAGERMKDAFVRSKDTAANLMDDGQATPDEYAQDKVQFAAEDIVRDTGHAAVDQGKKLAHKSKEAIRERRERVKERADTPQAEPEAKPISQATGRPNAQPSTVARQPTPQAENGLQPVQPHTAEVETPVIRERPVTAQTDMPTIREHLASPRTETRHLFGETPDAVQKNHAAPTEQGRRFAQQRAQYRAAEAKRQPKTAEHTIGRAPTAQTSDAIAGTATAGGEASPVERGRQLARDRARIKAKEAQRVRTKGEPTIKTVDASSTVRVEAPAIESPTCDPPTPAAQKQTYRATRQTRMAQKNTETMQTGTRNAKGTIKTVERTERTIKQSARSTGRTSVKTAQATMKSSEKAIKTAEQTSKAAIKTAQASAKTAQKSAQAAAKAAQKSAEAVRATAKAAATAAKAVAKAVASAVKAIIAAVKELSAAIAAGGWVVVAVIVLICLIGLIVASCFGIFFSSEDKNDGGQTMAEVVREINDEYTAKLEEIKNSNPHDDLEMSGSRAVWKEVLAVYAVKTTTDPDDPQEVASMSDKKKELLKNIFWDMNVISYSTSTYTETELVETDDGEGNIVTEEVEVTKTRLTITVTHKTAAEMAADYGFNADQLEQLNELLSAEYDSLWSAVLYGVTSSDDAIVAVALSQLGNVGGQPYWSWYGFSSRVAWCACFVSWCADQCGYIDAGVIPKYAGCVYGVQWFKDRGQWAGNDIEPAPGMIIFFDWDNKGGSGPQDGLSDHTGIVEKVENGVVYTIEGNSSDSCRENHYVIGHYEILGYGIPAY